jgi:hypothetical protein
MSGSMTLALDKSSVAGVGAADSYGTVNVRVVVLPPKNDQEGAPILPDPDEPLLDSGGGPLDSYLERPRGEGYVVFMVNGQRHDMLDEGFVQRDLGFKYLRTRTMLMIDVDGLAPESIAELVQGSRQGFYRGAVYDAILDRVIAVLKRDPTLVELEADAEQKISELKSGDEKVRRKLDELIEGHSAASQRSLAGAENKGAKAGIGDQQSLAQNERDVVVNASPEIGTIGDKPVLVAQPASETFRLYPGEQQEITIHVEPLTEWANLESTNVECSPAVPELKLTIDRADGGVVLKLIFEEPADMQPEDYPIKTSLTFLARFKDKAEPRLLERDIVVAPKKRIVDPQPRPELRGDPTFLRVVSRQPVRLIPGSASTHVRLRWDGEDDLTTGMPPLWKFSGRCLSLESLPATIFSKPRNGNCELLLDAPHGLLTGQQLEFEVDASGPGGAKLVALFVGKVAEPAPGPEPRKRKNETPDAATERKPPYDLKVVTRAEWDTPCWGASKWTKDDAGCFEEPHGDTPLTLIVNEDAEMLTAAREQMIARQLDENTIQERLGRYTAHIYFHQFNMYRHLQEIKKQRETEDNARVPSEGEMRAEINRVAVTLASLMDR